MKDIIKSILDDGINMTLFTVISIVLIISLAISYYNYKNAEIGKEAIKAGLMQKMEVNREIIWVKSNTSLEK